MPLLTTFEQCLLAAFTNTYYAHNDIKIQALRGSVRLSNVFECGIDMDLSNV